jgi:hypothetical protein
MSDVSGLQELRRNCMKVGNRVQISSHFCFSEVAVAEKKLGRVTFSMPGMRSVTRKRQTEAEYIFT